MPRISPLFVQNSDLRNSSILSGDLHSTVAGEQSLISTTNSLKVLFMSSDGRLTMQAKSITNRKAISMTQGDCLLNDNFQQFKGSAFKHQFLEDQRWAQNPSSSLGIRLPKLLILLFLLLIIEPSSVLAVPVHNCSAARYRHVRHVQHGNKNAIKPGSLVSFAQPSSASNLDFLEKSTSTVSNAPIVTNLFVLVIDTTSATTTIDQRPPIRPNTRTTSIPILVSVPAITASTLALSDSITSTPTLHPISIPIGTIIPSPPRLTLPPQVTVTNSASNFGVLWRSSSTSTSTSTMSATSQSTTSPAPTSTPSTSPPMPPDQHKYIIITIVSLSAIALIGLVGGFCILRYYARRRRARGPRREVELVEVIAPRCAQAVRDDLLNRRATVDGGAAGRNSLDDILAASGRVNASTRAASAAYESSRATSAAAAASGDEERRSRRLEKGGGSGEDRKGKGEWETLPPYVPR